ncbi:MAG: VOC family protein [Steroidobacteraceae bacterium]
MMDIHTTVPLAIAWVVISVGDMKEALDLWVGHFGMEVADRREGADAELARAWGLNDDGIVDQALLLTPGQQEGGVHLVRFREPGTPVRAGAAATDLLPKSVDVAVRDIEARHAELVASGYRFRSAIGVLETGDVEVHEVHMTGHDDINIVFVEQPAHPEPVSSKGYGVAPLIVTVSPDNGAEAQFLKQMLGLDEIAHNRFGGPQVEKTIGLPPGASLDVRILGDSARAFGRIELVQYEGVTGENRYPRARAPARGQLSITYVVDDLSPWLAKRPGNRVTLLGRGAGIYGTGRIATMTTPAGLRVDLVERASTRGPARPGS